LGVSVVVRLRSTPPFRGWTMMSLPLSYAMRVPSGDQAGRSSVTPEEFVMFCGVAPGVVRLKM